MSASPPADKPGVPIAPPLLFVIPSLVAGVLESFAPTHLLGAPWRWLLGSLLFLAGLALNLSGAVTQRRAGTDFLPERPSLKVVQHGPYAWSRNPMYLGFSLLSAGIAILADSLWILLAVPLGIVLIDRIIVRREERYLTRKFGEEYLSYTRKVRRWL